MEHDVCDFAAAHGHLHILEWAHANDAPWSEQTCFYGGHSCRLEVLQWLRANGCPWDRQACLQFAQQRQLCEHRGVDRGAACVMHNPDHKSSDGHSIATFGGMISGLPRVHVSAALQVETSLYQRCVMDVPMFNKSNGRVVECTAFSGFGP